MSIEKLSHHELSAVLGGGAWKDLWAVIREAVEKLWEEYA